MQLKHYQQEALDRLAAYLSLCRTLSPAAAYAKATADAEALDRLGAARGFTPLGDIPLVSLKIPTGGGKTIVAAHAIATAARATGTDNPLVLWLAPSDTIRTQTAEALKKARHPYREALEDTFGTGRVRVFDLSEIGTLRPADLAQGACIVVSTMQAFVKEERRKYNVYKDGEALEAHFAALPPGVPDGMTPRGDDPTRPACSFANLCVLHSPVIVADEVHHMTSPLSLTTLSALRPRAVIGLSATPERENNPLWAVRASELFAEEMVKLPVELVEYPADRCDWTAPVLAALAKRDELERLALAEWDGGRGAPWLRPIALFQAQSVSRGDDSRITAERLRRFLVEEARRPAGEIAVVTGEQKELDGVDVRDPRCPVRLVITVEALKEGWDCPSAAVLCSVANVHSETATVQLLGRVMRQPDAKRRKTPALDKAFAFVTSDGFGTAAAALAEGLRRRGFDKAEAAAAIQTGFPENEGLFAEPPDVVRLVPEAFEAVAALLPTAVRVSPMADGGATLSVSAELPPDTVETVALALERTAPAAAAQWRAKNAVARRRAAEEERAPFRTQRLLLPRLAAQLAGESGVLVFDAEDAYAELCDGFADLLPDSLPPGTFRMERAGDAFRLELDGETVRHSASFRDARQTVFQSEGFGTNVDAEGVVNVLDSLTVNPMISRVEKRAWISRIVASLLAGGATPDALFGFRHLLADVLRREMEQARAAARKKAYQSVFCLGGCEMASPELRWDDAKAFVMDASLADAFNGLRFYDGNYIFRKHFLGQLRIPAFDGRLQHGEGEEFACAQLIDAHSAVATWLRNPARHPRAFRLPVSDDWFYPDFVGKLNDGRFFAVEYKGEHIADTPDTLEKSAIGQLWADLSSGKCLYATVFKEKNGADVRAQLDALFRA